VAADPEDVTVNSVPQHVESVYQLETGLQAGGT
jgi:hypothetical protein